MEILGSSPAGISSPRGTVTPLSPTPPVPSHIPSVPPSLACHHRATAKMISFTGILTFIYNSLLVLFISAHLLVGGALTFGAGVYAGIYITQNYDVPRVDEPAKLWEKVKDWADSHKKKD